MPSYLGALAASAGAGVGSALAAAAMAAAPPVNTTPAPGLAAMAPREYGLEDDALLDKKNL
jgi:hypothetical protein